MERLGELAAAVGRGLFAGAAGTAAMTASSPQPARIALVEELFGSSRVLPPKRTETLRVPRLLRVLVVKEARLR